MPAVVVEPVSVGLQFGFLAVLYLFLLWVSRSALKDLRSPPRRSVPTRAWPTSRPTPRPARRVAGAAGATAPSSRG